MFKELSSQVYVGFLFLTVAFAWWKGGRAERIGSLYNALMCIGAVQVHAATRGVYGTVPILVFDGLLATGFLFLAFRYASLWLAAAMVLQALAFLIHASVLMGVLPEAGGRAHYYYYYMAMNLLGAGVMVVILLGTAGAWYRRTHPSAAVA